MLLTTSLSANKWLILNGISGVILQLVKLFISVETIAILMYKPNSPNSFKNEILQPFYLGAGKWLVVNRNTWNHLTVQKKSSGLFKNVIYKTYL